MTVTTRRRSVRTPVYWLLLMGAALVGLAAGGAPATAQYTQDFEDTDVITASEDGDVLTDQDEYYIPVAGSGDWLSFLYEGNALGFPTNPEGGDQFVGVVAPADGSAARAQRDIEYPSGGLWRVSFDICCAYAGDGVAANNIGSVSSQPFPGAATFIMLAAWGDTADTTVWDADFIHFDAAGVQITSDAPDESFQDLDVETWYRWSMTFNLDTNLIVSSAIAEWDDGEEAFIEFGAFEPDGWYLDGGEVGTGTPTGFRFFAGSADNAIAIDNFLMLPDCNENGVDDAIDIEEGDSADCNDNGVPDECEDLGLNEIVKLTGPDAGDSDDYGGVVAMDGGVMVVGAELTDEVDTDSGAAHVYRLDGEDWVFEQTLLSDDLDGSDFFGVDVDVSGDWIIVGARGDDDEGSRSGAAYIFNFDGEDWEQVAKLTAGDEGGSLDEFGVTVAIDGAHAAVGAWQLDPEVDGETLSNGGAVFTFRNTTGDWEPQETLLPAALGAGDRLGIALDLDTSDLVIGASQSDEAGSRAGAVFVYHWSEDDTTWVESLDNPLLASDAREEDRFGRSVSIRDNVIVVGAHQWEGETDEGLPLPESNNSGAAYVFRRVAGVWEEEAQLVPEDGEDGDLFGYNVATTGDLIVVGAKDAAAAQGRAYVYRCDDDTWTGEDTLLGSGVDEGEEFGAALAMDGPFIAAGAPLDSAAVLDSGAAFVLQFRDCDGDEVADVCQIEDDPKLDENEDGILDSCSSGVRVCTEDPDGDPPPPPPPPPGGTEFIRGDANNDGAVSGLPDGLFLLNFGFVPGSPAPACEDAGDANGDNAVNGLTDGLFLFFFQFVPGSDVPPLPYPDCGVDPDDDEEEKGAPTCGESNDVCDPP